MKTLEIHNQEDYDANKDFDGILIIKAGLVRASDNVPVRAWDNAIVEASGNATVEALGNATVRASGNATVRASGNATVRTWDNASILTLDHNQVHCRMNATSKEYIEPKYNHELLEAIADHDGTDLVLYKSVNPKTGCDFKTGKIQYKIGAVVECPDWDPDPGRECGGGLHLCLSAQQTQNFSGGRILKCLVRPEDVIIYESNIDKVRCRAVRPVCVVNAHGIPIEA